MEKHWKKVIQQPLLLPLYSIWLGIPPHPLGIFVEQFGSPSPSPPLPRALPATQLPCLPACAPPLPADMARCCHASPAGRARCRRASPAGRARRRRASLLWRGRRIYSKGEESTPIFRCSCVLWCCHVVTYTLFFTKYLSLEFLSSISSYANI